MTDPVERSEPVKVASPDGVMYVGADAIESTYYSHAHLHPETDLVARAICEKLDIDWRALRAKMEDGPTEVPE